MILFGCCTGDDGAKFASSVLPSIEAVRGPGDRVSTLPGDGRGICAVYNEFIREARAIPDCDALVLLHDDVEIVDPNFRAKVLAAVQEEGVGVVGVIGGAGLRSAKWWTARATVGRVFESRGRLDLGSARGDVDVVDGLLMVLAPSAFGALDFDEARLPGFHGYDVDYCLQAKAGGLRVVVRPIDVLHRTKGGYGDSSAFAEAGKVLSTKWSNVITGASVPERLVARLNKAARSTARIVKGALRRVARRSAEPHAVGGAGVVGTRDVLGSGTPVATDCVVCGAKTALHSSAEGLAIFACPVCGVGVTCPAPSRDVETDGLWVEMYGARRLNRRDTWLAEARTRIEWVELYLPDGCLLEVGAGTGEFVKVAEEHGFDAYGVEPSAWAAQQAVAFGARVQTGFLSDWQRSYPGLRPDAVALWHVLEHVPEPAPFLKEVAEAVRSGGLVFIEVPNFASSVAQRLGVAWEAAQLQDHCYHYTPDGLQKLLESCGFEVLQILPITPRIYESAQRYGERRNEALVGRHPWPSLDLVRVIALAPKRVTTA